MINSFEELVQVANKLQEELFNRYGENLVIVSEKYYAIMVFDVDGKLIYVWG
ncbi:hypothetical protein [Veillonella montpellierensis]|uniref:hypothetical protein n=1 Tax=Veillonella montpellierensis TaxID=187328 RepID=UPI0012E0556B|nr:hypothetical protein [Veillonella montpellierensis]